jgi:hypothetical protein
MNDVSAFTVYRLEGRAYIVESAVARRPNIVEYAVAHELTEGVFQVTPFDENAADGATRMRNCTRVDDSRCRITTAKQLFAFARATEARQKSEGGLVLRLANSPESQR